MEEVNKKNFVLIKLLQNQGFFVTFFQLKKKYSVVWTDFRAVSNKEISD